MSRRLLSFMFIVGLLCLVGAVAMAKEITVAEEEARAVTGMEVEVSSLHHRLTIGPHIIDGDVGTRDQRWISQAADTEPWAMFMLPEVVTVDAVVLYSGMDAHDADPYIADTYVIEAMQGADWVQVARVEGNLSYRCVTAFPAVTANAWRIRFIKANNWVDAVDYRARIFEVRLLQVK
ncbi:MAG TPA: discoidin domain-containing protein [Firmicutes bacterium]|jgi:hypothetical protein|nr:discoidin domain-containing protein [Bacillota bacterium]